jgi:hypothetical protein
VSESADPRTWCAIAQATPKPLIWHGDTDKTLNFKLTNWRETMINLLTLPADEAESIAYTEGFTMAAQLFARIDELELTIRLLQNELDDKERLPVRYFIIDYDLEDGPDIVECDELNFLNASGPIEYKRHTVRENGVNQICLTKEVN